MAKIGTAHVEVKPVLNEDALAVLSQQIEDAVAAAVAKGFERATTAPTYGDVHVHGSGFSPAGVAEAAKVYGEGRL